MRIPQVKSEAQATTGAQKSLVRQALEHKDVTREILGHLSASDAFSLAQVNRQTRMVVHEEVLARILAPVPSTPAAATAPLLNPLWVKNISRSAHAAVVHKQLQSLGDHLPTATMMALTAITLPTVFLPAVFGALANEYKVRILPQKQQARRDRERPTRPSFEAIKQNASFTHALLASGALGGASADIDSKYFQYLALPALLAEQQQKQLQAAATKLALSHQWKRLEELLAVAPVTSMLGLNAQQLKSAIDSASRARRPASLRWLAEQGSRVDPNILRTIMVATMSWL